MKRVTTLVLVLLVIGASLPAIASAAPQTNEAKLAIEQSDYISEGVGTARADNSTVYIVHDRTVEVKPQNFKSENVVGYGVLTDAGELSYNGQMDTYRFNAGNNTGTFTLYWEVEEQRVVEVANTSSNATDGTNATTTEVRTVRQRYTATIRVDSAQSYQHIPAGSLQQTKDYAENWRSWKSSLTTIWGDDVDVQQKTQWSVNMNKVAANPTKVLSGGFTGILLAMVMTPGGLLVLALFLILFTVSSWSAWKYIRQNESLKAEEQSADEKLEDIELEKKVRRLANADWNDLDWPDSVARAYRRVGKTPLKAICKLGSARLPENIANHRLQAMAQEDYVGVVDRADARADGGEETEPPIESAEVVHKDEVPADAETHDLSNPSDAFVAAVVEDCGETVRDFDLLGADIDPGKIHVEQAPMDIEDLMRELDVQSQDFEDPDEWAEYLLEFVEFIREHQFTDDHGSPDEIQFIINEWMDTDDVLADIFGFPHFKLESEALALALDHRDPVEEASQLVDEINDGQYS